MGKTYSKKDKPKKPVNRVAEAIAQGNIQLGRAGKHDDKRKLNKYKPDWSRYD